MTWRWTRSSPRRRAASAYSTHHMEKFDELVATAIAHHNAGQLDQAEAAYRDALAISPGHAAITHNLGVLAAAQGNHAAAIVRVDEAIAAEPSFVAAHYNRPVAHLSLGQPNEVLQGFARVCALDPG